MTDAELKERFDTIEGYVETLAKLAADQQLLILKMTAHQHAHLAAIRDHLVKLGEDKTFLNQRLRSAYEQAINLYQSQIEAYGQSGDVKKLLLDSPVFPDIDLSN